MESFLLYMIFLALTLKDGRDVKNLLKGLLLGTLAVIITFLWILTVFKFTFIYLLLMAGIIFLAIRKGKDLDNEVIQIKITPLEKSIKKDFRNDTYYIIIENPDSEDFQIVKNILLDQYKSKGYDTVSRDTEERWHLKSSINDRTYIWVTLKNKTLTIEAYNVKEEPIIPTEIKEAEKNDIDITDKLIELAKMLEKGLLTEDEFKEQKKKLLY